MKLYIHKTIKFLLLTQLLLPSVYAQTNKPVDDNDFLDRVFDYDPQVEPTRVRNTWWSPMVSLLLPGFDQWWEGQYAAAGVYTGVALGGSALASSAQRGSDQNTAEIDDIDEFTDRQRQLAYGLQLYQTAGSLSAYHSFRTAVETRKNYGQYKFLTTRETSKELILAPFQLEFLTRPSTWVPLLVISGIAYFDLRRDTIKQDLVGKDLLFASGISYNAGVGEEALFRGYLMPVMMQSTDSLFWSNAITSVLFGAAHYSDANPLPVAQTLMGYYLGWLTQRNQWSLQQSIFLHAWWDVIAISYIIASEGAIEEDAQIQLPLFEATF